MGVRRNKLKMSKLTEIGVETWVMVFEEFGRHIYFLITLDIEVGSELEEFVLNSLIGVEFFLFLVEQWHTRLRLKQNTRGTPCAQLFSLEPEHEILYYN